MIEHRLLTLIVLFGIVPGVVRENCLAEEVVRHGLITSAACPYTCSDAHVSKGDCRQWQVGEVCFVEDLLQAPGHRSMFRLRGSAVGAAVEDRSRSVRTTDGTWLTVGGRGEAHSEVPLNSRGLVTTANCPLSCRDLGVPEKACREWKAGGLCHIEDLRQGAGHQSMLKPAGR